MYSYWIKKTSDVRCADVVFCQFKLYVSRASVCGIEEGIRGNVAVYSQLGTHPSTKATTPSKGF
jgi:hypothetical protein